MSKNKAGINQTQSRQPKGRNEELCYLLLKAETEQEVTKILQEKGMLNEADWQPLGDMENNWGAAGNQQSAAAAALVEKVVNGIDSVLINECLKRKVEPTSPKAPQSMSQAAQEFFKVPSGRLENIPSTDRTALADKVQVVAVGSKENANYLIIDKGEGQAPADFPETFLSLAKSNKMRIQFVQGKYNAGGTGALRFCGYENYQLIISRRAPEAPCQKNDPTNNHWGFTLIRRLRPKEGDNRRSSVYVYYAPGGKVPSFQADAVSLLPGPGGKNSPPTPYAQDLQHGSCIKLYTYRWNGVGLATLEVRFQLNKYLHNLVLPIRVTEARPVYKANFYSTTVSGGSIDDNVDLDLGPASGSIALPNKLGIVPVEIKVFKEKKADGSAVQKKHLPLGVLFTVNGQVHGSLGANFIRKLNYPFLEDSLLLVVDATNMPADFREDFFMASRDRLAEGDDKDFVEDEIREFLRSHEGLRLLNNKRKEEVVTKTVEEDEQPLDILQEMISDDPALAALFGRGEKLKAPFGGKAPEPYKGKKFPTYFKLRKENLIKDCPINRTCRVEFETDAANDYFSRGEEPGVFTVNPDRLHQGYKLFEGTCSAKFCPPINAEVGDLIPVEVSVIDPGRAIPFVCTFQIRITPKENSTDRDRDRNPNPRPPKGNEPEGEKRGAALPPIHEISKEKWSSLGFTERSGLKLIGGDNGDPLEAFLNVDNFYVVNELTRAKDDGERQLIRHYYKFGMVLVCLGMLQEAKRASETKQEQNGDSNGNGDKKEVTFADRRQMIDSFSGGVAAVIVPIVKSLAATAAKALKT